MLSTFPLWLCLLIRNVLVADPFSPGALVLHFDMCGGFEYLGGAVDGEGGGGGGQ